MTSTIHQYKRNFRSAVRQTVWLGMGLLFWVKPLVQAEETGTEIEQLKAMVRQLQQEVVALKGEVRDLKGESANQEQENKLKQSTDSIRDLVHNGTPTIYREKDFRFSRLKTDYPVHSKFDTKLYGYFKADFFRDSATTAHQEIPFWVLNNANDGGELDFTARQTRLGFLVSTPHGENDTRFSGKLEMDFYGFIPRFNDVAGNHAYQLRTRLAYLQWENDDWRILAGKAFESYILEYPEMLNFGYYNFQGQLGHRRMQLAATRKVSMGNDKIWETTLAVDEPVGGIHGGDLDGDGVDDGTDAEFPAIVFRSVYAFPGLADKTTRLGVSGFYAQEKVYGSRYDAYALILGGSIPLSQSLSLKGSIWSGQNVDSAWGGIGQGINPVLETGIGAVGGWIQLRYKPGSKYWFNVGYSMDDPDDADLNAGQRSLNVSYLLNAYYKIADPLIMGAEYFRTDTDYRNQSSITNHRFQGSLIYSF